MENVFVNKSGHSVCFSKKNGAVLLLHGAECEAGVLSVLKDHDDQHGYQTCHLHNEFDVPVDTKTTTKKKLIDCYYF